MKAHIIVPHFSSQHFQLVLPYFRTALMPVSRHNQSLQMIKSKEKESFQLQVQNFNSPYLPYLISLILGLRI